MNEITNINVAAVFEQYHDIYRKALINLRQLIFDTAEKLIIVGEIEESLKWGQPSYSSKSGSPIRIDRFEGDKIALFFHCQTSLVENFRVMFGDSLEFSKNRAIVLEPRKELPVDELTTCIEIALTYHKNR